MNHRQVLTSFVSAEASSYAVRVPPNRDVCRTRSPACPVGAVDARWPRCVGATCAAPPRGGGGPRKLPIYLIGRAAICGMFAPRCFYAQRVKRLTFNWAGNSRHNNNKKERYWIISESVWDQNILNSILTTGEEANESLISATCKPLVTRLQVKQPVLVNVISSVAKVVSSPQPTHVSGKLMVQARRSEIERLKHQLRTTQLIGPAKRAVTASLLQHITSNADKLTLVVYRTSDVDEKRSKSLFKSDIVIMLKQPHLGANQGLDAPPPDARRGGGPRATHMPSEAG
ncbi:hypothetical protein EVAR_76421_1 [Eumeta japonica]|uniref:Uncharacterized protein n=1 Tax=Eumeta variegata TaxID=151549 RepID=A0A4C1T8X9_EUMVA|nr:hypothetical protein EVAR_76421_1 [Eumeta japonica]